jgi:hypothetical protein
MRTPILAMLLMASTAAAESRPKLLVLPLAPTSVVDANTVRAFDARLLVALDDARRVHAITHDEEPACTTLACLAELGAETGAAYVLSLAVIREEAGLTVFGTLVDVATKTAWRRIELPRVTAARLARTAPRELVPQILGTPAGGKVVAFARPTSDAGVEAARALAARLANARGYRVLPIEAESSRAIATHRADLVVTELAITEPRRHLCTWLEGRLIATLTLTELATGRVVLAKTIEVEEARRKHFSSRAELRQLLLERAVGEWEAVARAWR